MMRKMRAMRNITDSPSRAAWDFIVGQTISKADEEEELSLHMKKVLEDIIKAKDRESIHNALGHHRNDLDFMLKLKQYLTVLDAEFNKARSGHIQGETREEAEYVPHPDGDTNPMITQLTPEAHDAFNETLQNAFDDFYDSRHELEWLHDRGKAELLYHNNPRMKALIKGIAKHLARAEMRRNVVKVVHYDDDGNQTKITWDPATRHAHGFELDEFDIREPRPPYKKTGEKGLRVKREKYLPDEDIQQEQERKSIEGELTRQYLSKHGRNGITAHDIFIHRIIPCVSFEEYPKGPMSEQEWDTYMNALEHWQSGDDTAGINLARTVGVTDFAGTSGYHAHEAREGSTNPLAGLAEDDHGSQYRNKFYEALLEIVDKNSDFSNMADPRNINISNRTANDLFSLRLLIEKTPWTHNDGSIDKHRVTAISNWWKNLDDNSKIVLLGVNYDTGRTGPTPVINWLLKSYPVSKQVSPSRSQISILEREEIYRNIANYEGLEKERAGDAWSLLGDDWDSEVLFEYLNGSGTEGGIAPDTAAASGTGTQSAFAQGSSVPYDEIEPPEGGQQYRTDMARKLSNPPWRIYIYSTAWEKTDWKRENPEGTHEQYLDYLESQTKKGKIKESDPNYMTPEKKADIARHFDFASSVVDNGVRNAQFKRHLDMAERGIKQQLGDIGSGLDESALEAGLAKWALDFAIKSQSFLMEGKRGMRLSDLRFMLYDAGEPKSLELLRTDKNFKESLAKQLGIKEYEFRGTDIAETKNDCPRCKDSPYGPGYVRFRGSKRECNNCHGLGRVAPEIPSFGTQQQIADHYGELSEEYKVLRDELLTLLGNDAAINGVNLIEHIGALIDITRLVGVTSTRARDVLAAAANRIHTIVNARENEQTRRHHMSQFTNRGVFPHGTHILAYSPELHISKDAEGNDLPVGKMGLLTKKSLLDMRQQAILDLSGGGK
jgi:hypothetical protein